MSQGKSAAFADSRIPWEMASIIPNHVQVADAAQCINVPQAASRLQKSLHCSSLGLTPDNTMQATQAQAVGSLSLPGPCRAKQGIACWRVTACPGVNSGYLRQPTVMQYMPGRRYIQVRFTCIRCALCYGHTIQNNPVLVRSRKANWIGPDQYYVG